MGKFADFYAVAPAEAGRAARSMGGSKRWPHYSIKFLDVFQLAKLYDLLRGQSGTETWKEFRQDVEADGDDEEDMDGPMFMITTLPDPMLALLAGLDELGRQAAERWQAEPEFFWRDKPGTAAAVLLELCRLARTASERGESVVLVESGD